MPIINESRPCGRPSAYIIPGRIDAEDTAPAATLQASYLVARYTMSDAVARLVAEHAFAKGVQR